MNIKKLLSVYILVFLISLIKTDTNQSCPLRRCSQQNLEENTCSYTHKINITEKDGSFYEQYVTEIDTGKCTKGVKTCPPVTIVGYVNCTDILNNNKVEGETCSASIECYSGLCKNGVCTGKDKDALCSNTGECKIGLYCFGSNISDPTSICKEQVKENATCSKTTDCINSHFCYSGTCIPLFTLKEGTNFTIGMDPLQCESAYEYGNVCSEFIFLGNKDYLFRKDSLCSYNFTAGNRIENFTGGECAWDGSFNNYCSRIGTEHSIFVDYKNKVKKWYFGESTKKHSFRRSSYPNDILSLYYQIQNWPHLINADKCSLSLFFSSSSSAIVKFSLYSLLGLIFFLLP